MNKVALSVLSTLVLLGTRLFDKGLVILIRAGNTDDGFVLDIVVDQNRIEYDEIVEKIKEIREIANTPSEEFVIHE